MNLTILASGSTGNGYILHNENEALIIEAGVKLSEVKIALDFNISHIVGCLISHSHNDHAGYLESYARAGIRILTSEHVLLNQKDLVASTLCKVVESGKGYKLGNFKVVPFELSHDVPCLGFLIDHPETGRIIFITDSYLCEYCFDDVNHWIIEANYSDEILEEKIMSGSCHPSMRPRLLSTHMELQTCKSILLSNDLSNVINIVLVHLSSGNSNQDQFVREVRGITGKNVYAACRKMIINFNKIPY